MWEGVYSVTQLNPAVLGLCHCCTFIIHVTISCFKCLVYLTLHMFCSLFVLICFVVPKKSTQMKNIYGIETHINTDLIFLNILKYSFSFPPPYNLIKTATTYKLVNHPYPPCSEQIWKGMLCYIIKK